MVPKKNKRKKNYTLMIVSNGGGGVKQHNITAGGVRAVIGLFAAVIVILAAAVGLGANRLVNGTVETASYKDEIADLSKRNSELVLQNEELNNKITILSDTINVKVEKEEARKAEDAQKSEPKGFPLSGTAKMTEANANEGAGEGAVFIPMIIFEAAANTNVIAAGDGTVSYLGPDDTEYGNMIKLDHGNGYVSVYRNAGEAKVSEGDEVTRGTLLFEMGEGSTRLGYEIIYNDKFIEPLTVLDIAG